ncbi:MAG: type I-C CRISPR-associated protein Cas8c/Csd1 [Candidatus Goldbacteria bacterium]|nr:type I-C CRISPR-associated protein Cas8c/Csd1 [Candidatus Goldiibacteriota bacterium]
MILRALYDYYQTMVEDPESGISSPGYSKEKISFALVLDKKGNLKDIIELGDGNKPKLMDVPVHTKRTSGVSPYFLCDNVKYLLGYEKQNFEECVSLHKKILSDVDDESAKSILKFFEKWSCKEIKNNKIIKEKKDILEKGGFGVFIIEGINGYAHEKIKIKKAWEKYYSSFQKENEITGQCLITGEETKILDVHDPIKGVRGAQSSGAAIVSFNQDAFKSYNKEQSINAPIGKNAAFAYVTALNYMLAPKSIQNILIGDTTTVFWAEKYGTGTEELIYALLQPSDIEEKKEIDVKKDKKKKQEKIKKEDNKIKLNDIHTINKMRDFLNRISQGKEIKNFKGIDENVKFYILGLSPNKSRISIRFFYADTFGKIVEKIKQHYDDMRIEKQYENERDAIAVWEILKELAAQGKSENIPPAYSGGLMQAILTGGLYPAAIYQAIINRIGIDKKINRVRAAFIKAYIVRKIRINKRKGGVTMSLNTEEKSVGYQLGRLFALLEKAQLDVSPNINATIKDRYFGTASSSPKAIFPILLRLAQHHISAAEYGKFRDKQIEEIMNNIKEFPAHLTLDEQGMFMLGYYHQRNDLYKKKEKEE